MAIGADLGFNLDAYRFYGYNQLRNILFDSVDIYPDSISVPKDSVSQRFFEFYTNIHFFNGFNNKLNLDYRADLDFQVMNDKFGANEIILTPKFNIQKLFGNTNAKNRHRVFADIFLNYTRFNFDTTTLNRTIFNFHPGIELNFGKFKAIAATNLGTNTGYSNLEVIRATAEVTGINVPIINGPKREGDPAILTADSSKFTSASSWQPKFNMTDILSHAWAWYNR